MNESCRQSDSLLGLPSIRPIYRQCRFIGRYLQYRRIGNIGLGVSVVSAVSALFILGHESLTDPVPVAASGHYEPPQLPLGIKSRP